MTMPGDSTGATSFVHLKGGGGDMGAMAFGLSQYT